MSTASVCVDELPAKTYDGIVLAVAHDQFRAMGAERIRALGRDKHVIYDLKHLFAPSDCDLRL